MQHLESTLLTMFNQLKHSQILIQYLFSKKLIDKDQYRTLKAEIKFSDLINENSKEELFNEIIDHYLSLKDYSLPFLASSMITLSHYPLLEIGVNIQNTYYNAIKYYLKYHQITDRLSSINFSYNKSTITFTITPISQNKFSNHNYIFSTEYHLGEILHLIKKYIPSFGKPKKITLKYSPPQYVFLYNKMLECKHIEFNSNENTIVFQINENELFNKKSPISYNLLGQKIFSILDTQNTNSKKELSLKEKIVSILDCYDEWIPNENFISKQLNMHERTLRRRLQKEGETFRSIITNYKKEKAIKLLFEKRLSQKQIAIHLGFKDTTSFGRAFKIWTGKTPKDFISKIDKI